MSTQWLDLRDRFKARLKAVEEKPLEGNAMWRLRCLEHALELLEEDPDAASKYLDDFDRLPSAKEEADIFAKVGERPNLEDIRMRFDNLGGGIV